jgi:hypothetical protein
MRVFELDSEGITNPHVATMSFSENSLQAFSIKVVSSSVSASTITVRSVSINVRTRLMLAAFPIRLLFVTIVAEWNLFKTFNVLSVLLSSIMMIFINFFVCDNTLLIVRSIFFSSLKAGIIAVTDKLSPFVSFTNIGST